MYLNLIYCSWSSDISTYWTKLEESELLWLSDNVTVQTRIMKLRATRGTCNPNLQIAVTQMYGPYVASIHMEFHEE